MNRANKWYKQKMKSLRAGRGSACESCGSTLRLEWAHVKPTGLKGQGRGFNSRVRDIINYPESYKLLCKVCHYNLDNG